MAEYQYEIEKNFIKLFDDHDKKGQITYDLDNALIRATYIYVEPSQRGKGYADALIDRLNTFANDKNAKVEAICPVIKRKLQNKYPELLA